MSNAFTLLFFIFQVINTDGGLASGRSTSIKSNNGVTISYFKLFQVGDSLIIKADYYVAFSIH